MHVQSLRACTRSVESCWAQNHPQRQEHLIDPELPAEAWNADLRLMLCPTAGVTDRLGAMRDRGVLAPLLPDIPARPDSDDRVRAAIGALEQLLDETTLAGKRFGSLLRELRAPDLLVLSLLLRDGLPGQLSEETLRTAQASFDHLHLAADERRIVEFLGRDDLRMAKIALLPDADDPQSVEAFASYLNSAALFSTFTTEEHLKMLCLLTLVTLGADGALTPLKSELLWRFFVDTYNHLMKSYGDEVIEARTIAKSALNSSRPPDISEPELIRAGRAAEAVSDAVSILSTSTTMFGSAATSPQTKCTSSHRSGDVWDLTCRHARQAVPLLEHLRCARTSTFDILDGQALTSTRGVVLTPLQSGDPKGVLELIPRTASSRRASRAA
jgi:UTP:GlnB (protein PII) uridylyltransferase